MELGRCWFEKTIIETHHLEIYSIEKRINEICNYFTRNAQGFISTGKTDDTLPDHPWAGRRGLGKREAESNFARRCWEYLGSHTYGLPTPKSQPRWDFSCPLSSHTPQAAFHISVFKAAVEFILISLQQIVKGEKRAVGSFLTVHTCRSGTALIFTSPGPCCRSVSHEQP